MKLEALTVCVGYSDFLAAIVPVNLPLFDRWIIITDPTDTKTRNICLKYHLHCVLSEDHKRETDTFNKGRLVERALHHCSTDSWRLHIDADIALPNYSRKMLERAHLHKDCIYGVDRVMVKSYQDWKKLIASGYLQGDTRQGPHAIDPPAGFQLGSRWANESGYVPIGFFQLWHSTQDEWCGVRVKPYPIQHGAACRSDVQHSLQWDRQDRILIPEFFAIHLESGPAKTGANWKGRTTPPFGPALKNTNITPS